jgi:hypothetical protein
MGKNPESHHHPPPFDPFQPEFQPEQLVLPAKPPKTKNRHFNQGCSPVSSEEIRSSQINSFHSSYNPHKLFFPFSAQKSHVKPQNHLTYYKIIKLPFEHLPRPIRYTGYIDQKNTRDAQVPAGHFASLAVSCGRNSFPWNILDVTHL